MFDINNRATWASSAVVGERIHRIRIHAKLTCDQLCEQLYISLEPYKRWRSGVSYPQIDMLNELADIFNVTLEDLVAVNSKIDSDEYKPLKNYAYTDWSDVDVSNRIRDLMKKRHISKHQLAKIAGVSVATINNWLGNRNCPSKISTEKLARHFNMSVKDLLREDK